jgi:hypothetical protein
MKNLFLAFSLSLILGNAVAAPQWCSGKVTSVYITKDGGVNGKFAFRNEYLTVCNMNSDWKGVSSITCTGILAILKDAVARKADVANYYETTNYTCADLPTYSATPAADAIMLVN